MKLKLNFLTLLAVFALLASVPLAFAQKGGKKGGGCTAPPPELMAQPTCFLPGCLDGTFGDGVGRVIGPRGLWISGVAIQTIEREERIVAVGRTASSCIANSDLWTVARYLPDGTLDESFGNHGVVYEDFGNSDSPYAVAVQPDGKLVVAGYGGGFAVARYNQDGSRDLSFGTGGMATVPEFPTYSTPYAVALQSDGKIVAAGQYYYPRGMAVVRLNTDGTFDTEFNGDGRFLYWSSQTSSSVALAITFQMIDTEERIVVAGYANGENFHSNAALLRLTTGGMLDTSFGGTGVVTTDFLSRDNGYAGIAVDSQNRLVAAGYGSYPKDAYLSVSQVALARYNENGTLDSSFGTGGKVLLSSLTDQGARALAIQPDGRILVAGQSSSNAPPRFAVWRFLDNGTLDPGFGANGLATTEFVANHLSDAMSSVLQTDGKLVAAGISYSDSYMYGALARYLVGQEVLDHDVAVLSISPRSSGITQGDVLTVDVEVANLGQNPETAYVRVTESPDGNDLGSQNAVLDPGRSATVTFDWSTTPTTTVGEHTLQAALTATDDRPENDSASTTVSIAPQSSGYDILLTAAGYKDQGRQVVNLAWTGSQNVDIYRDAQLIASGANGTSYTDRIGSRGGGSYEYQVCESGTETCSNVETVTF